MQSLGKTDRILFLCNRAHYSRANSAHHACEWEHARLPRKRKGASSDIGSRSLLCVFGKAGNEMKATALDIEYRVGFFFILFLFILRQGIICGCPKSSKAKHNKTETTHTKDLSLGYPGPWV